MFKKVFFLLQMIIVFLISVETFAGTWDTTGEYYRYNRDGYYVYNEFIEDNHKIYYLDENGYMAKNKFIELNEGSRYYATADGSLYIDGTYKIDGNIYFFDQTGKILTGWIDEIYYANDEGYLVTGFQKLKIPEEWKTEEEKHESEAWFYFNTSTGKKVYAESESYTTRLIMNHKYCFDQNGLMKTGWRQIKETTPVMKGYMYFVPEETSKFKFGEAVTATWYSVDMPYEVVNDTEIRYFYFNGSGNLYTAGEGKKIKVRVREKNYIFNEYGYAVYGVQQIDKDYYYCGENSANCSIKTGKVTVDNGSATRFEMYFDENNDGKGYTGVYKNKLYYCGLLQKASEGSKYMAYRVRSVTYLVNSSGFISKNKSKVKDGDGVAWSTDSSGIVTYNEGGEVFEPTPPETTDN